MKGLLLVLILSPVILFAQTRQKAMVDSIRAASNNIQKVSSLVSKYPGTKVESIDVSDSDEYVTVVVRIHAAENRPIPILSPAPVVEVKIREALATKLRTAEVPPLPFIIEKDTIMPLSYHRVVNLEVDNVYFHELNVVPIPPLPFVKVEMEALLLLSLNPIAMDKITFGRLEEVSLPPLPLVKVEMEPAWFHAPIQIKMEATAFDKLETVPLPPLPLVKVEMDGLPLLALTKIKTEEIVFDKPEIMPAPPLPLVKVEIDTLPLMALIQVRTDINLDRLDIVAVPPLPEIEGNVALPLAATIMIAIEPRPRVRFVNVTVPVFEDLRTPVAEMHLSDEGYTLLEKMEGFSPELYALGDGGLTIGFGFFVSFNEADKWRKGVTWEDAERMMRQKVPAYEDQVKKYINVPLTQEEFDALTMLAYNLGGFSKATSIVNDINGNADYEQLQKDWMRFVHSKAPNVMKGLMNRRNDELQVKNALDYQPQRKVLIFKNKK